MVYFGQSWLEQRINRLLMGADCILWEKKVAVYYKVFGGKKKWSLVQLHFCSYFCRSHYRDTIC